LKVTWKELCCEAPGNVAFKLMVQLSAERQNMIVKLCKSKPPVTIGRFRGRLEDINTSTRHMTLRDEETGKLEQFRLSSDTLGQLFSKAK
jgi:hypothetical protein